MVFPKDFNHSYWELKHYFKNFDLIVIGSGIVGLSTAISFKQQNKKASVLILEKGIFPDGASTKNAGFACFGSPGELLNDLDSIPEDSVWATLEMRWKGLSILRRRFTDKELDYRPYGGYELFRDKKKYECCLENIEMLNKKIKKNIGLKHCYQPVDVKKFGFKKIAGAFLNQHEGQLDTSVMMHSLLTMARDLNIEILNNIHVNNLEDLNTKVQISTTAGIFSASKVVVATNGFASQLLKIKDVTPARAQVLITKPIRGLKIKGSFNFDMGFYYFRNIDNRILFGGGRNLDLKKEFTSSHGLNEKIQKSLDFYLKEMILPDTDYEIEHRWTGIMGVGEEKKPIIQNLGKNILAAVRMGGMGIAIGSWVGENAASQLR